MHQNESVTCNRHTPNTRVSLPESFAPIKPVGHTILVFRHLTHGQSAIFDLRGGPDAEFGLVDTGSDRSIEPLSLRFFAADMIMRELAQRAGDIGCSSCAGPV